MGLFARTVTSPIGGCFLMTLHLIDGLFMAQTEETFHTVAQSKLSVFKAFCSAFDVGSLDFFVSFSSMMAVTGNIGQSNYATANAILDGELKKYPNAFSIMIPGISNVGYLSRSEGDAEHTRLDSWSVTSDGGRMFLTRRNMLIFSQCFLRVSRMVFSFSLQEQGASHIFRPYHGMGLKGTWVFRRYAFTFIHRIPQNPSGESETAAK